MRRAATNVKVSGGRLANRRTQQHPICCLGAAGRHSPQELQAKDATRRHLADACRTILHATAALRSATLAVAADGGTHLGQRYYQRQEAVLADMLVTLCELPAAAQGAAPAGSAAPAAAPTPAGGGPGGSACEGALAQAGPLQHGGGSSGGREAASSGGSSKGVRGAAPAAEQTSQGAAGPAAAVHGAAANPTPPPVPLPAALSAPPPAQLPCWARLMPSHGAEALAAVRRTVHVGQADIAAEVKLFAQTASLEFMRCAGCMMWAAPRGHMRMQQGARTAHGCQVAREMRAQALHAHV